MRIINKPEGEDKRDFEQMISQVVDISKLEIGEDGFYADSKTQAAYEEFKEILFQMWANSSDGW